MGVQLTGLLPKEVIEFEILSGRKIAIDALNSLYQFLAIIRQPDGTPLMDSAGRITSHLSGLFYRTAKLVEMGIRPCYVFDGEPPEFKKQTLEARSEFKTAAELRWSKALERGDIEEARTAAQATSRLTNEMRDESIKLLEYMGIPVVRAPSEGEAQAAFMLLNGDVYAVGSQDYDSLLFGAKLLIRNLTLTGRRKVPRKNEYIEIKPEMIELDKVEKELGITREQLIIMGIIVGTDYNPQGVRGFGPKKALALVKERKTLTACFKDLEWIFGIGPEKIFEFFMKPDVTKKYSLEWKNLNREKIIKLMVDEHNFSEERIDKVLKTLESMKAGTQGKLDSWMKK